ncbi:hypothetical protein Nepgr_006497 [Nepenthes gracilis]|uniref:Uncharacterized protein n=1 Tax=Nepenthes gracilis TaxID=150966 RepID=A0AAD3S540_NEPGR|nr:hypothetical protein Nepgr_006497 [Nepenthes gracilis]
MAQFRQQFKIVGPHRESHAGANSWSSLSHRCLPLLFDESERAEILERKRDSRGGTTQTVEMITRHNLAEQLREYQIRSKQEWASASFFTASTNFTSRVDIVIFVIWELVILAFLVFSAVSLYFRHMRLAFILVCVSLMLLLCMKITKQVRLARKKKRRMLLPLSM